MKNCIFCQIVKGKSSCHKIYEDKLFLAFLDIAPFVKGHTQVIPKKHYRWVWDVPEIGKYFSVVRKIVNHYQKVTKDQWVASIVWGSLVHHAHIQVLPSPHKIDLPWPRGKLTQEKGKKLRQKLALK
jgi:histidine triad (HIT) family protein